MHGIRGLTARGAASDPGEFPSPVHLPLLVFVVGDVRELWKSLSTCPWLRLLWWVLPLLRPAAVGLLCLCGGSGGCRLLLRLLHLLLLGLGLRTMTVCVTKCGRVATRGNTGSTMGNPPGQTACHTLSLETKKAIHPACPILQCKSPATTSHSARTRAQHEACTQRTQHTLKRPMRSEVAPVSAITTCSGQICTSAQICTNLHKFVTSPSAQDGVWRQVGPTRRASKALSGCGSANMCKPYLHIPLHMHAHTSRGTTSRSRLHLLLLGMYRHVSQHPHCCLVLHHSHDPPNTHTHTHTPGPGG